jgi:hypothetical protein
LSFKSRNLVKISISEEFSKFKAFFTSGSLNLKKIFVLISSSIVEGIVGFLFFKTIVRRNLSFLLKNYCLD